MKEFKVGDKVSLKNCSKKDNTYKGIIVDINYLRNNANVKFEGIKQILICSISNIELLNENKNKSIHIYANGTTTTAVLKENNNVIKTAIAKCNPDDTYDFESGARIAFDRLVKNNNSEYKVLPNGYIVYTNNLTIKQIEFMPYPDKKYIVGTYGYYEQCAKNHIVAIKKSLETDKTSAKEVSRPAKVGEYVKIIDICNADNCYKKGDIFKVLESFGSNGVYIKTNKTHFQSSKKGQSVILHKEYVVLENYVPEEKIEEKPKFRPYVYYNNKKYGYIGEETIQEDLVGNKLKVGDTVMVYYENYNEGEYVLCKGNNINGFVLGYSTLIFKKGRSNKYSIIKYRSYKEIKNGEVIDNVKYILSE